MKKLVAILVVVVLACGTAYAADWALSLQAGTSTGTNSGLQTRFGEKVGATVGYDTGIDAIYGSPSTSGAAFAYYNPLYAKDTNNVYKAEYRPTGGAADVQWASAEGDLMCLWLGAAFPAGKDVVLKGWTDSGVIPADAVRVYLEIISDPTGKYAAGTQFDFTPGASIPSASKVVAFSWDSTQVNGLRNKWTTSGVTMKLCVKHVPEPSSLLALASGLAGLAGFAWRRRA